MKPKIIVWVCEKCGRRIETYENCVISCFGGNNINKHEIVKMVQQVKPVRQGRPLNGDSSDLFGENG